MFDATAFHPDHLADLRKSGLSDDTIEQAGLYSVRPDDIQRVTAIRKVTSLLAIPYTAEFTRYKVFPTRIKVQGNKFRYTQPKGSGVQPSSRFPIHIWGMKPTVPGRHGQNLLYLCGE